MRLAYKAGIPKLSKTSFKIIEKLMKHIDKKLLEEAIAEITKRKGRFFGRELFYAILANHNINRIALSAIVAKKCPKYKGEHGTSEREKIYQYQIQTDCVNYSPGKMELFVNNIARKLKANLKISRPVLNGFQVLNEKILIDILRLAQRIASSCNKSRVNKSIIQEAWVIYDFSANIMD